MSSQGRAVFLDKKPIQYPSRKKQNSACPYFPQKIYINYLSSAKFPKPKVMEYTGKWYEINTNIVI